MCSRREADALIEQGQVSIDGEVVTEAGRKIQKGETLVLAGAAQVKLDAQITAVLNKPVDYVSAQPEGDQIPAVRLVTKANLVGKAPAIPTRATRLAPAGRLDQDSRGLLLLTEDGVLTKAVIGENSHVDKEYLVTVTGKISREKIQKLRHGLSLDGKALKPAKVTQEGDQLLRFILIEGKKRQLRRMCELVQLHVVDLTRVRIGPVRLGDLPEGKWRAITEEERSGLLEAAKGAAKRARSGVVVKQTLTPRPRPPGKKTMRPRKNS